MNRIGTCSLCGGPVSVPSAMVHPTPHCETCGAIPKNPHGPLIPMDEDTQRPWEEPHIRPRIERG